jgi:hypothetical protein
MTQVKKFGRSVLVRPGPLDARYFARSEVPWDKIRPIAEMLINERRSDPRYCYVCWQPIQTCDDKTTFFIEIFYDENLNWVEGYEGCGACCEECSRKNELMLQVELYDEGCPFLWPGDPP